MYHTIVTYKNTNISCFGELLDDSNFHVVCEDEEYDDIWCLGNSSTDKPFQDWEEVVSFLSTKFPDIVEISAC